MDTVAQLVRAQRGDVRPGVRYGDAVISRDRVAAGAAARAALLRDRLPAAGPPHVGVLLGNVPEYPLWLGAAALAGAVVVGVNPTRRGAELARDITHTECALLVTERAYLPLLEPLGLRLPVLVTDEPAYGALLAAYEGANPADAVDVLGGGEPEPRRTMLLCFTSGSTGTPKAVVVSQGRLAAAGRSLSASLRLGPDDVHYVCMPLFHGNAVIAGWATALAAGGAVVLRRAFSASRFLPDVRRHGATYFTYVGRAVQYVLATPPSPADRDHRLRLGFGTEAGAVDAARFAERFGAPLVEGYGSSEGGAAIQRTPGTPPGAVGRPARGDDLAVVDPATGAECPPGTIGELVNRGPGRFEGYWKNPDADAERTRRGWYWTGDLFYRDAAGFLYFAGRRDDRLRVDGENLAAAVVENILARYPPAAAACVYPVPDPVSGDQVMAALALGGAPFDPAGFRDFLAAEDDLGTKAAPRFVRPLAQLPLTATNKIRRAELRAEGFLCAGPVWWRPGREPGYRPLTAADVAELRARFAAQGREGLLEPEGLLEREGPRGRDGPRGGQRPR